MSARFWYHVSRRFLGERPTLVPRLPCSAGDNEPETDRICVGPTVAACLAATLQFRDVIVYRTAKRGFASEPSGVWDANITGERWLLSPTRFMMVAILPYRMLDGVYGPLAAQIEEAGEVTWHQRASQYRSILLALARSGLGVESRPVVEWRRDWEHRFADGIVDLFDSWERAA